LRLQGQANDFKIQYSSILRLFVLPKVVFILHTCWDLFIVHNNIRFRPCFLTYAVTQSTYLCGYHTWSTNSQRTNFISSHCYSGAVSHFNFHLIG